MSGDGGGGGGGGVSGGVDGGAGSGTGDSRSSGVVRGNSIGIMGEGGGAGVIGRVVECRSINNHGGRQ